MPRHDLDPVALVAGVVFIATALAALLESSTGVGARWVVPVLLIGVGIAGLLATRPGGHRATPIGEEGVGDLPAGDG